jgi:hypothetical protein
MSNTGNYFKNEEIREVAAASLTTGYVALGAPLEHRSYIVTVFNTTNGDVYFTRDPTVNTKRQPADSGRICDFKSDDGVDGKDTQYYVKWAGTPPMSPTGNFWIEVEYT